MTSDSTPGTVIEARSWGDIDVENDLLDARTKDRIGRAFDDGDADTLLVIPRWMCYSNGGDGLWLRPLDGCEVVRPIVEYEDYSDAAWRVVGTHKETGEKTETWVPKDWSVIIKDDGFEGSPQAGLDAFA